MIAESLKREVWYYLMRVPPYDDAEADARLEARAESLCRNSGLVRVEVDETELSKKPLPSARTPAEYADRRVRRQATWYLGSAGKHLKQLGRLERWVTVLGAISVAAGLLAAAHSFFPALVPLLTTVAGVVLGLIHATRLKEMIQLYQDTASRLLFLEAGWRDRDAALAAGDDRARRAAAVDFVRSAEAIMAQENESWRTAWMDEEAAGKLILALQDARSMGSPADPGTGASARPAEPEPDDS